jgi:hypothetical protein
MLQPFITTGYALCLLCLVCPHLQCLLSLTLCSAADFFDAANADFFYDKMPFAFGAGMCYITGVVPPLRSAPPHASIASLHSSMARIAAQSEDVSTRRAPIRSSRLAWICGLPLAP